MNSLHLFLLLCIAMASANAGPYDASQRHSNLRRKLHHGSSSSNSNSGSNSSSGSKSSSGSSSLDGSSSDESSSSSHSNSSSGSASLDESSSDDGANNSPFCPATQPGFGDACTLQRLRCEYGSETCCGMTTPSVACTCSGGQFACFFLDRCRGPCDSP